MDYDPADKPHSEDHAEGAMSSEKMMSSGLPRALNPDSMVRPDTIGPYKVLETLGEGGMGFVYLAEQASPIKRRVALKVIKLGMDTGQVVARFEAERQALAMMNHPNVAKVFGGGATEGGRPYFVMEHVQGVPITVHCDRLRLNIHERLGLFMKVCEAVQHAHQKGIIHRDLKPGNVLVAVRDGEAVPKVIDFGVAKALHQPLTEKTLFTEFGMLIGTPAYMSPEQAEMTAQDIDTRSDIYSLGVLLYELLAGVLPFDWKELRPAGMEEIPRMIREVEPVKPSTRFSGLDDESKTIASNRHAEPNSLAGAIRGDLDWIVMKCLEKDRSRRYETANGLAADLQRHLDHEPVIAGPPSSAYRMKKFVRRNRAGVVAASVVLIVLLAGIGGTTWGLVQANSARDAEAEQRLIAENEAENAKAINDFLTDDLLAAVAPSAESGKGKDVLMRDVLDVASEKIDVTSLDEGRFGGKPLIEASVRRTLGETYHKLGEYESAEPHLVRASHLRQFELGMEHPDALESMYNLAVLYHDQGRYDEAEPLHVTTLDIRKRVFGKEHPKTLDSMNSLANLYNYQGRYDEAEVLFFKTLDYQKRILGEEHIDTLGSMNNLAVVYTGQGRFAEAEPLFVNAMEISIRTLGEEHPRSLNAINSLSNLFFRQGHYNKAEPLFIRTLEVRERILGDEHPLFLDSLNNLAILYATQGKLHEAEPLFVRSLDLKSRVLGEEHPSTLNSIQNLAILYASQGRYEEAEPLSVRALEVKHIVLGEEHSSTLGSMSDLANIYAEQDKDEKAESLYVTTLGICTRVLGEEHPRTFACMDNLAVLYAKQKRFEEAEPLHIRSLDLHRRVFGEEHPATMMSLGNLIDLYSLQSRMDDARPLVQILKRIQLSKAEIDGASAKNKHDCSKTLLACNPADLRDPKTALRLALEAVEMTDSANPEILDTLALAMHLTGDTSGAVETEKIALSLLPTDSPGRGEYEAALLRYQEALLAGVNEDSQD